MDKDSAINLLETTFKNKFNMDNYVYFLKELFNKSNIRPRIYDKIRKEFWNYENEVYILGDYHDDNGDSIALYAVELTKQSSRDRARTMQRNLIASLIKDKYDSALVAFYEPNLEDWRFSHVKIEYEFNENGIKEKLSSPRRHSFLVGINEPNHTCQSQFLDLIRDEEKIQIKDVEQAFSIENVTDEFFDKYKELFLDLVDSLDDVKKEDEKVRQEFDDKDIKSSDFAKKLMGQIVFIYFLQKKGWLGVEKDAEWGTGPKNFLRIIYNNSIKKNENFFNDVLEPLFYEGFSEEKGDYHYSDFNYKVPFLNGGLFEPIKGYKWRDTDLILNNSIFEDILNTFDKFNFTVKEDEPLEKEIAVDPEMLGKVFENLLEVNDRKSKGAFYTPRHIVHFMCQESLISYLSTNSNVSEDDLRIFITRGDSAVNSIIRANDEIKKYNGKYYTKIMLPDSIKENSDELDHLLKNVKVIDPAVGSGAFPVGMMNEIVKARYILRLLNNIDEIDIYDLKHETIENSLYGVDIELSATDITKLRFWLSLIVDEDDFKQIKPLPNLDNKIMCGNSVIDGYDNIRLFDDSLITRSEQTKLSMTPTERTFEKLESKKKEYFDINGPLRKKDLKEEINELKLTFIENYVKSIGRGDLIDTIKDCYSKGSKPFFIWELEFSEVFKGKNPGFDIVIGNPPYVRYQRIKDIKPYLDAHYECYLGTADLYVYFFEKGFNLMKDGGCLTFICSNKYTRTNYGKKLRKLLLNNSITHYIDYTGQDIFKNATVDSSIIVVKKSVPKNNEIFVNNEYYMNQSFLNENNFVFNSPMVIGLRDKIYKKGILIKDLDIEINYGIKTAFNKAFIINESLKNELINMDNNNASIIKPVLRGRDIQRNFIDFNHLYLLYIPWEFQIDDYPKIKEYLSSFKEQLSDRAEVKKGRYEWFALHRYASNYVDKFSEEKIIYSEIASEPRFAYDNKNYFLDASGFIMNSDTVNLKYLLALLNSKLLFWYFIGISPNLGSGGYRYQKVFVEQIPIIIAPTNIQNTLIQLVDTLMELNEKVSKMEETSEIKKQIEETNIEIDKIIYELYDLSSEEIDIVEEEIR